MVCIEKKTTMSYRGTERQTSVLSGLATDGVPVRVSEKLFPPPLVSLPRNFQIGNPSEVLFMEYDFVLEEKVIQTAEIQRRYREALEAQAEAQAEAERQAQEAVNEVAREAVAAPAENADAEEVEVGAEANEVQEVASSANEQLPPVPAQPRDVQSLFLNLGPGNMLTPTPIVQPQPRGTKTPTRAPGSGFNLADFENEQDPFDNLELKTLNDMEELNKVLQGAQPTGVAAENPQSGSSESVQSKRPALPNGHAVHTQNFPHQNLKDVDYPDIDSLHLTDVNVQMQTASFYNQDATRQNMYSRHSAGGQYYNNNSNYSNNGYLPNLPQVTRDNFTKSTPLPPIDSTAYSQSGSNVPGMGLPANSSFVSLNNKEVTLSGNTAYYALNGNASGVTECNPLRSSRSTPDITKAEENMSRSIPPKSHTPPPYQYGSRSRSGSQSNSRPGSRPSSRPNSPAPRPSTQQDWNKYSILPSTLPRLSGEMDKNFLAAQLPDPYSSLSHEEQRLANSISDMGFRRARVARVVQKLGQDERKVLDHLCAVNRIHESGFPQEDAEVALHQFDQNEEKALQYLKLLGQFKELGFSTDKIRGALISADLNENKALDMLTST